MKTIKYAWRWSSVTNIFVCNPSCSNSFVQGSVKYQWDWNLVLTSQVLNPLQFKLTLSWHPTELQSSAGASKDDDAIKISEQWVIIIRAKLQHAEVHQCTDSHSVLWTIVFLLGLRHQRLRFISDIKKIITPTFRIHLYGKVICRRYAKKSLHSWLFLLEVKSVNLTYNSVYLFWFLF